MYVLYIIVIFKCLFCSFCIQLNDKEIKTEKDWDSAVKLLQEGESVTFELVQTWNIFSEQFVNKPF